MRESRTLQLLLFQAERALAFSQELQREVTAVGQNQNASTYAIKKEQNSRLRKAVAYATELYDIAQELSAAESPRLDALTLAEIATYLLHIQATASFAKSRHEDAIVKFVTRRKLLALLSDNAITSHAQALANQSMDESDPLIRFCAYKMGRKQGDIAGGQSEVDAIVADFDDEAFEEGLPGYKKLVTEVKQFIDKRDAVDGGVNKQMLEPIRWAGEAVEIRNAEVVRAMVKVQTALKALQSDDAKEKEEQEGVKKTAKMRVGSRGRSMKRWDNVLATLGDAEAVARRQIVDDVSLERIHGRSGTNLAFKRMTQAWLEDLFSNRLLLSISTNTSSSSCLPTESGEIYCSSILWRPLPTNRFSRQSPFNRSRERHRSQSLQHPLPRKRSRLPSIMPKETFPTADPSGKKLSKLYKRLPSSTIRLYRVWNRSVV
jgi:signal recognition particle subunit SRP68